MEPIRGILKRPHASSSLVVNGGDDGKEVEANKKHQQPSVEFDMCDNGVGGMVLIEYPDKDERRLRWYTQSEYGIFKCKLLEDLCSISIQDDMISYHPVTAVSGEGTLTSPNRSESKSFTMMCVGMEKIITTEVTLQVKQRQAKHLQTILVEQLRQDILGVVDMEVLSRGYRTLRPSGHDVGHISMPQHIGICSLRRRSK